MSKPVELACSAQFTLQALFEITACCALVFAVLPFRDLILFSVVFAALSVWSIRVARWSLRLPLMVWLGGCCGLCLGLACLERAFASVVTASRVVSLDHLAFFGTLTAILGGTLGAAGLLLLLLVLSVARRAP